MQQSHVTTHRFDPAQIYLSDEGVVMCGAHVGTEATYTPWQWSAVGPAPIVELDGMMLRCEDSSCNRQTC